MKSSIKNKIKIKHLSIDLDGTLLNKGKIFIDKQNYWKTRIEQPNIESLKEFVNYDKNSISLSTGRNYSRTKPCADYLESAIKKECIPYLSCFNGALVVDNRKNEAIFATHFNVEELKELLNFLLNKRVFFILQKSFVNDLNRDEIYYAPFKKIVALFLKKRYGANSNIKKYNRNIDHTNFAKILVLFWGRKSQKLQTELEKKFGTKFNYYISGLHALEISPKDANKLWALELIAKKLKMSLKNCCAIGDNENDYLAISNSCFGVGVDVAKKNYLKHINDASKWETSNDEGTAVHKTIVELFEKKLIDLENEKN